MAVSCSLQCFTLAFGEHLKTLRKKFSNMKTGEVSTSCDLEVHITWNLYKYNYVLMLTFKNPFQLSLLFFKLAQDDWTH